MSVAIVKPTGRAGAPLWAALWLASASACNDGATDDGAPTTDTGTEAPGDGDGDPGDGDGDPGDGDPGDGDPGDGDPGDGDPGDGDGDPGDTCNDDAIPNLTFEARFEVVEEGWDMAERWSIDRPAIPDDPFFPDARSEQTGQQLEFFALDPTPAPNQIVVQFAPGWDTHSATPVLLVHGADDPPDRAWANPGFEGPYGCGDMVCPSEGMMQALADAGIPVFAIAFPNKQGDNFMWVEQIHAAVKVVLERTCAEQVDVIGWSKGAFAARMYGSNVHADWGSSTGAEVRKLILIGGPNLGMDYAFRYGSGSNTTVWPPGMVNGPTAHHEQLVGLQVVDRSEYAIYETAGGYYYRGQAQMLALWIDTFDLTFVANNGLGPYATVDTLSTYYGEQMYAGTLARGHGAAFAVDQGSIVDELVDAGISPNIETFLLCSQVNDQADFIFGIANEISGPSDGVVFVQSCAAPDGIGQIGEIAILQDLNHLELGWDPQALQTVIGWLAP